MKIAEMNKCIEKMREIYKFDDKNTEIEFYRTRGCSENNLVEVKTVDKNSGVQITMTEMVAVNEDNDINWTDFYEREDD